MKSEVAYFQLEKLCREFPLLDHLRGDLDAVNASEIVNYRKYSERAMWWVGPSQQQNTHSISLSLPS